MGFADVTLQVRQMSGKAYPLQIEAGCFSADGSTGTDVATRLVNVVGGLCFACETNLGAIGRPMIGPVCEGGFIGWTYCGDLSNTCSYLVAGW